MKDLQLYGIAKDGELELSMTQLQLRKNFLSSMKADCRVIEILKTETKQKTHQQIKAIFGLAIKMIKEAFDSRGWDSSVI